MNTTVSCFNGHPKNTSFFDVWLNQTPFSKKILAPTSQPKASDFDFSTCASQRPDISANQMCSNLLPPSTPPSRTGSHTLSSAICSPGRQLQLELEQYVNRAAMVSTRSQDLTPAGINQSKEDQSSTRIVGKRKIQNEDLDDFTPSSRPSKEPRVVIPIKSDVPSMSKTTENGGFKDRKQGTRDTAYLSNGHSPQEDGFPAQTSTEKEASTLPSTTNSAEQSSLGDEEFKKLPPSISDEVDVMSRETSIAAGENHVQSIASHATDPNSPRLSDEDYIRLPPTISDKIDAMGREITIAAGEIHTQLVALRATKSNSPSLGNVGEAELQRPSPAIGDEVDAMGRAASIAAGEMDAHRIASRLANGRRIKSMESSNEEVTITSSTEITKFTSTKERPSKGNTHTPNTPPAKGTHKRFDSEDPVSPQEVTSTFEPTTTATSSESAEEKSDDDDEAPETVTASAGHTQARAAALDEAKATVALRKEKKRKRRERDRRLKEQKEQSEIAQKKKKEKKEKKKKKNRKDSNPDASTRSLKTKLDDSAETMNDDNTPLSPPTSSSEKENSTPYPNHRSLHTAPQPLPLHILSEDPPLPSLHPAAPPHSILKASKKRKLLDDMDSKPPKDIKIRNGKVRVRVLPDRSSALPPKANGVGKGLRELWLLGMRAKGGVQRREWGKGKAFVRK